MVFYSFFTVIILLRKKVVLPGALRCGIFQLIAIHLLLDLKWTDPQSVAAFPIWPSSCSSWTLETFVLWPHTNHLLYTVYLQKNSMNLTLIAVTKERESSWFRCQEHYQEKSIKLNFWSHSRLFYHSVLRTVTYFWTWQKYVILSWCFSVYLL